MPLAVISFLSPLSIMFKIQAPYVSLSLLIRREKRINSSLDREIFLYYHCGNKESPPPFPVSSTALLLLESSFFCRG